MFTQFGPVSSIDFSRDNTKILSLDRDHKQFNVWQLDTYELLRRIPMANTPSTAKFSKSGDFIGVGFDEKDVVIYTGPAYTATTTITNPLDEPIVEIDFSWNGNFIAMCGKT